MHVPRVASAQGQTRGGSPVMQGLEAGPQVWQKEGEGEEKRQKTGDAAKVDQCHYPHGIRGGVQGGRAGQGRDVARTEEGNDLG
eukprot:CAMPEP_0117673062 /NCGR_PEP_ID=MMETSP0804-20121206/14264_1 /TAXON_ID=1074897 /ORGANISM="Tetraselmis astigmatica, Strain CCMP880" /LENGTH=83 /DNA_ID=CAMNT_0005481759 /DNA_START=126 /DNA_END=378 /DNA_ORIENTATION=-